MTKEEYFLYEKEVNELLSSVRDSISTDVLNGVEHYLEHGEIEMAFELFCLGVIDNNINFSQDKKNKIKDLAERLGLQQETVFEDTFWDKLKAYVSAE